MISSLEANHPLHDDELHPPPQEREKKGEKILRWTWEINQHFFYLLRPFLLEKNPA